MSFQKDFLWGAASAAYQVEGAYDEDGKGPGIWDALSSGHIKHGETGNVACDHYHRYKEDVALMKELGLKSYRFSVSWPRIMPKEGVVNEKGLQFYKNLVHELVSAGIEPMCTLFHWNLPMWVNEKGGWHYDGISDDFAVFTKVVVEALSDRVSYWMTVNEPATFIGNGYITGSHAPFEQNAQSWEAIGEVIPPLCKNVLLSHGKAVETIRTYAKKTPKIGMALNGNLILPWSESEKDIAIAKESTFTDLASFFALQLWGDPMIKGELPAMLQPFINQEELAQIHQPLDFFGYNCYNSFNYEEHFGPNPALYPGLPRTAMDWPITPEALYWASRFIYERYGLPIIITENGMANIDFVMSDGKVHDPQRIEFLKCYLQGLKRAVEEGVPVIGYQYWSILDNFEWADGYDRRFGLIYVDYRTLKRTLKDSAYWYAQLIKENGETL
ncbi:MAG: family 1 glycosylhydrolase [Lachnospiraceae bacterium]|nr:family 1 glycosylhydrolase [Lachnospiraceae bacterium]